MKKYLLVATLLLAGAPLARGGAPAIPPPAPSPKPASTCGDSGHALGWNGTAYACQAITGGSAAAGGSNTQLQRNNGGAIDGITGATSDGTSLTVSSGNLKLSGATSGTAIVNAPGTGGGTLTLPPGSDTIAGIAATQTLTNKTISGAANTLTVRAASDITGTLPVANGGTGITALGTGVATALGQNVSGTGAICLASGSACTGGGGGSLTVTDGTNSVSSTTTLTAGNGFVVGGSAGSATLNLSQGNATKAADYTVAAANMGGCINLTGSHTLTIPAISGTVFAAGQSLCVANQGTGTWTLSSTPAINGLPNASLPPGTGFSLVSNGTSLDYQPGMNLPTSTVLGGVTSSTLASHNFATGISTAGALTGAQPSPADLSGLGTGVATALGAAVSGSGSICLSSGSACSGGGGGAVALLATVTPASSSGVNCGTANCIFLTGLTTGEMNVRCYAVTAATSGDLIAFQFHHSGGGWDTTASNYKLQQLYVQGGAVGGDNASYAGLAPQGGLRASGFPTADWDLNIHNLQGSTGVSTTGTDGELKSDLTTYQTATLWSAFLTSDAIDGIRLIDISNTASAINGGTCKFYSVQ